MGCMKVLNLNSNTLFMDFKLNYFKIIALFRIAVVLVAVIDFSSVLIDLNILISNNSILPWELGLVESDYYLFLKPIYNTLINNGINLSLFIYILSALYLIVLSFCGIGFHTKKSFFIALILQIIIFRSIPNFNYGYDNFITMSFFYCLIFPVGYEFSLDKEKHTLKNKNKNSYYYLLTTFLKTHLSIVYLVAGIAKSVDINWWNGNAIWRAIATLEDFIYINPFLLLIISSLTVVTEISYPFIAFSKFKKAKKLLLFSIISMHLGIGVVLGLSSFASIMIIWNIVAFYNDFRKE